MNNWVIFHNMCPIGPIQRVLRQEGRNRGKYRFRLGFRILKTSSWWWLECWGNPIFPLYLLFSSHNISTNGKETHLPNCLWMVCPYFPGSLYALPPSSPCKHGSEKWVPPIVVSYQIQPFSTTTMNYGILSLKLTMAMENKLTKPFLKMSSLLKMVVSFHCHVMLPECMLLPGGFVISLPIPTPSPGLYSISVACFAKAGNSSCRKNTS